VLPDGRVLIVGGGSGSACLQDGIAGAEMFDPSSPTWTLVEPASVAPPGHTATRLVDGRVLIAGGVDDHGDAIAGAEVLEPSAPAWVRAGSMGLARAGHTATRLSDGSVLVAGGGDAMVNGQLQNAT